MNWRPAREFIVGVVCDVLESWDDSEHPRDADGKFIDDGGADEAFKKFDALPRVDFFGNVDPTGGYANITGHSIMGKKRALEIEDYLSGQSYQGEPPMGRVNISSLKVVQPRVERSGVEKFIRKPPGDRGAESPTVVQRGKSFYLMDGTHRMMAEKYRGEKYMTVVLVKMRRGE
jgi:hypothetical protein